VRGKEHERADHAERLLRLACERIVGTPIAEQSHEIDDIALAIDAALLEHWADIKPDP
jgi:hypothetical protein